MQLAGVEWDEEKNEENKRKYKGLGFEIAQYVFSDPERLERRDVSTGNLSGEERWQSFIRGLHGTRRKQAAYLSAACGKA
ncbi:MAG: BrnT family toxin [Treponema sp.]|jgi:uncharacterized DUF497 family protein|nr:BrnT family toxin [Treponema sp.]